MAHEINFKPSIKQAEIFELFRDENTTEVVYGGSVASGKSYLIGSLLVMQCLQHPGIRIGLGRNTLTNLKKTTVITILEVLGNWGLIKDTHFTYNSSTGEIKFYNGSEIVLVELTYIPSDPNYTRLGGMLLTFGCIDEATEVDEMGKNIFQTRLGRWKNNETGIKPFLLMTCNPSRSSFIYRDYYKPWKDNKLQDYQAFVQALPTDNNYLPVGYIENLQRTLSLNERKRLLQGQWELEDDPNGLFASEDVSLMWDTSISLHTDTKPRISCDVAFTSDKCVIIAWNGLIIKEIVTMSRDDGKVHEIIKSLAEKWAVKPNQICWDADGVGKYLKGEFPSGTEIHNNGKPVNEGGYRNLKAELYFKLAEFVKDGKLKIEARGWEKDIEEELSVIKHKPRESMSKLELVSKSEMKRTLGRSPDITDAMAYGMYFHLKNNTMSSDDFGFVFV